jgi:NAD-dependent dihydropyrimidine dehydrogenase PreA subunit
MFHIDSAECTGCGYCVDICPQHAITIEHDVAVIDQGLCINCGLCAQVCPISAIKEVAPVNAMIKKGGVTMVYGYGRGLGFRGASPPWPYVGRGRGGLPRCWYPSSATVPAYAPTAPLYTSQMTQDQEIDWLKSQAEIVRAELDRIEARMRDLEAKKAQ